MQKLQKKFAYFVKKVYLCPRIGNLTTFLNMEDRRFEDRREPEIVYSKSVKAGKRIYYLDVKKARNEDLYLCITESKRKQQGEDQAPQFEKHKLFLYKEDFAHFTEGLKDVIGYIEQQLGSIESREAWKPTEEAANDAKDAPEAEAEESEKKKGLFNLFKS